ncbi:hypothetical protein PQX77_000975 [Marasmius sp. AFHP31]|nr:hypothetical protein PQX77_000975 [Marasmius sp. AFHP31]
MTKLLQVSLDRAVFIEDCFGLGSPSPHKSETIAQHLPAIQSDIARLDAEIVLLRSSLTSLENHRDRLYRSIVKGRALIPPPVHRLPRELLCHIFTSLCSKFPGSELTSNRQKKGHPPLPSLLSMVCRSWREIVLSTSSLWSTVFFDVYPYGGSGETGAERLRRRTEMFMTRARACPLTIVFACMGDFNASDPLVIGINRASEILFAHSSQWISVNLRFLAHPLLELPALRTLRGNFPILRSIAAPAEALSAILSSSPCPALRNIEIEFGETESPSLLDIIPWQQVGDLTLIGFSTDMEWTHSLLDLLASCPELKSLKLHYNKYHARSVTNGRFTRYSVNSKIESLTVTLTPNPDDTEESWVTFFNQVTLPRLSSLALSDLHKAKEIEDASSLFQCITRSACLITSLTLPFELLPMTANRHLLSLMPNLTAFTLSEYFPKTGSRPRLDRTRDFLRLLSVDSNSATSASTETGTRPLLPRLQHVSFDLWCFQDPDNTFFPSLFESARSAEMTLYRAVASRWFPDRAMAALSGVNCLQSVSIKFRANQGCHDLPDLERLRKLGEEGLEVFLSFY